MGINGSIIEILVGNIGFIKGSIEGSHMVFIVGGFDMLTKTSNHSTNSMHRKGSGQ
jgi:hypothetical protein